MTELVLDILFGWTCVAFILGGAIGALANQGRYAWATLPALLITPLGFARYWDEHCWTPWDQVPFAVTIGLSVALYMLCLAGIIRHDGQVPRWNGVSHADPRHHAPSGQ